MSRLTASMCTSLARSNSESRSLSRVSTGSDDLRPAMPSNSPAASAATEPRWPPRRYLHRAPAPAARVPAALMTLIAIWKTEREPRMREPDQPAEHDVIDQHQRRRPDADAEIGFAARVTASLPPMLPINTERQRNLQQDERAADRRRRRRSREPGSRAIRSVSPAPIDCAAKAVVLMRTNANSQNRQSKMTEAIATPPSIAWLAEPADRRGRDDADQRRRQVCDHRGARDGEHLPGRYVRRGNFIGFKQPRIRPSCRLARRRAKLVQPPQHVVAHMGEDQSFWRDLGQMRLQRLQAEMVFDDLVVSSRPRR